MKIITFTFALIFLFGYSTVHSQVQQAQPETQPTATQSKIVFNGNFVFKAYRALEGSQKSRWQEIHFYPGSSIIILNDCGSGPHIACPYVLYIFTEDKLTDQIKLKPAETYRILSDTNSKWHVEVRK